MAEKLTKMDQINSLNGGIGRFGVIVSLIPADIPLLSSEKAQARVQAGYGIATGIAGQTLQGLVLISLN